jgi:hypothetical protein
MTSVSYQHGTSGETDATRLCREKARDCQRAALMTTDPKFRLTFLHLAKLWREYGRGAEQKSRGAGRRECRHRLPEIVSLGKVSRVIERS